MTEAAILEGLSTSKLAVELNDDERRILAGAMTLRDLKQGDVLVREGSADDHLYVVVSGVLGVVKGAGMEEEVTLNAIRPGNMVGELSFLDGASRYASLVAWAIRASSASAAQTSKPSSTRTRRSSTT